MLCIYQTSSHYNCCTTSWQRWKLMEKAQSMCTSQPISWRKMPNFTRFLKKCQISQKCHGWQYHISWRFHGKSVSFYSKICQLRTTKSLSKWQIKNCFTSAMKNCNIHLSITHWTKSQTPPKHSISFTNSHVGTLWTRVSNKGVNHSFCK